jgi:hypothetical protein
MAYHSKHSKIWHKFEKCVDGNNIETDNKVSGPSKKLCDHCKDIERGKAKR